MEADSLLSGEPASLSSSAPPPHFCSLSFALLSLSHVCMHALSQKINKKLKKN